MGILSFSRRNIHETNTRVTKEYAAQARAVRDVKRGEERRMLSINRLAANGNVSHTASEEKPLIARIARIKSGSSAESAPSAVHVRWL
jgi:hypothetical protein